MYLSIGQTALFLGVAISTLRRWDNDKQLVPGYRTPGGHRRYLLKDLENFAAKNSDHQEKKSPKLNIAYARVSSSDQKLDLKRQEERLAQYCQREFLSFFGQVTR